MALSESEMQQILDLSKSHQGGITNAFVDGAEALDKIRNSSVFDEEYFERFYFNWLLSGCKPSGDYEKAFQEQRKWFTRRGDFQLMMLAAREQHELLTTGMVMGVTQG